MEILVKPYTREYAVQCADLEQYLWPEDARGRMERFEWTYHRNPNSEPLAVIAVNEKDEVLGFRPFFPFVYMFNGNPVIVAQFSDTVVSNKARRMGILAKMNDFALVYLKEKGIKLILNLSPSWPPYFAYKKIGFEDFAPFHSRYYFGLSSLFADRVIKSVREWNDRTDIHYKIHDLDIYISQSLSDEVAAKVRMLGKCKKITSSVSVENMNWRKEHPNRTYAYAYSFDTMKRLRAFFMFMTKDYYNYHLGLSLSDNMKDLKQTWNCFKKAYRPAIVAGWDFALEDVQREALNIMGFISIPFVNEVRKNPPALIRTLQTNSNGSLDWIVNGLDVRHVENWNITKFDLDSF